MNLRQPPSGKHLARKVIVTRQDREDDEAVVRPSDERPRADDIPEDVEHARAAKCALKGVEVVDDVEAAEDDEVGVVGRGPHDGAVPAKVLRGAYELRVGLVRRDNKVDAVADGVAEQPQPKLLLGRGRLLPLGARRRGIAALLRRDCLLLRRRCLGAPLGARRDLRRVRSAVEHENGTAAFGGDRLDLLADVLLLLARRAVDGHLLGPPLGCLVGNARDIDQHHFVLERRAEHLDLEDAGTGNVDHLLLGVAAAPAHVRD